MADRHDSRTWSDGWGLTQRATSEQGDIHIGVDTLQEEIGQQRGGIGAHGSALGQRGEDGGVEDLTVDHAEGSTATG